MQTIKATWLTSLVTPLVVLVILGILFFGVLVLSGKILIVGDGFQFNTIQGAVDAADSGDIILVTSKGSP